MSWRRHNHSQLVGTSLSDPAAKWYRVVSKSPKKIVKKIVKEIVKEIVEEMSR
jgi:hypothetical protein